MEWDGIRRMYKSLNQHDFRSYHFPVLTTFPLWTQSSLAFAKVGFVNWNKPTEDDSGENIFIRPDDILKLHEGDAKGSPPLSTWAKAAKNFGLIIFVEWLSKRGLYSFHVLWILFFFEFTAKPITSVGFLIS